MVKKLAKQYDTPDEGWSQERIDREIELMDEYGLKNKKEVYKAQSTLRDLRRQTRNLISSEDETQKEELIEKAHSLGLIKGDSNLEDILTLSVTDILDRRLQTAVNRKGFSDSVAEARQKVTHGHVKVDGQKVTIPGYLLTKEEEKNLELDMPENEEDTDETEEEGEE